MTFVLENEMKPVAIKHMPEHFHISHSTFAHASEVPLSYKVADIGFAVFTKHEFKSEQARHFSRLKTNELWKLATWLTNNKDAFPQQDLELRDTLLDVGIIQLKANGSVTSSNWLVDHFGILIMVELKLSKWSKALEQAIFYSNIADYSCVVLSSQGIDKVDIDQFSDQGIGLFSANKDSIELIQGPRISNNTDELLSLFYRLSVIKDLSSSRPRKWELVSPLQHASF